MSIQDARGNLHDGTGKFTEKPLRDAPDGLLTTPAPLSPLSVQELRNAFALSAQMRDTADRKHKELAVTLAKDELRRLFPTAVRAYVSKSDDYDASWSVEHVVDAGGHVLYHEHLVGDYQTVLPANDLVGEVDGYWFFDQVDEDEDDYLADLDQWGSTSYAVLDLTSTEELHFPEAGELIGLDDLPRRAQDEVLRHSAYNLGQILIAASKYEFEYYLTDEETDAVGADETTIVALEEKYGDREAALQALIETRSFQRLDEGIHDVVRDVKVRAITAAIQEALAATPPHTTKA